MSRLPRGKNTPFFTGRQWARVGFVGLAEAVLTLAAFWVGKQTSPEAGTTMAFATLAFLQLFAALGFQSEHSSVTRMRAAEHKMLWLGLGISAALQLVVLLLPPMRTLFKLVALTGGQWLVVLGLCLVMLLVTEVQKWNARRRHED
jgi:Ca2+-transporting ATPase